MKTFSTAFVISFISLFLFQSCVITQSDRIRGNGQLVHKEVSISDYDQISLIGSADIVYEERPERTPYAQLHVDENILPYLDVKTEGGKLIVKTVDNANIQPTRYTIYTNSSSLAGIQVTGSGEVALKRETNAKRMQIGISGSGTVVTDSLYCEDLSVNISGSGRAKLAGVSGKSSFGVSGSGKISALQMSTQDLTCTISGSGNVESTVNQSLDIKLSGSGNFKYRGNPDDINQRVSGSGKIQKLDL